MRLRRWIGKLPGTVVLGDFFHLRRASPHTRLPCLADLARFGDGSLSFSASNSWCRSLTVVRCSPVEIAAVPISQVLRPDYRKRLVLLHPSTIGTRGAIHQDR